VKSDEKYEEMNLRGATFIKEIEIRVIAGKIIFF
jgi:hypothetical protein